MYYFMRIDCSLSTTWELSLSRNYVLHIPVLITHSLILIDIVLFYPQLSDEVNSFMEVYTRQRSAKFIVQLTVVNTYTPVNSVRVITSIQRRSNSSARRSAVSHIATQRAVDCNLRAHLLLFYFPLFMREALYTFLMYDIILL